MRITRLLLGGVVVAAGVAAASPALAHHTEDQVETVPSSSVSRVEVNEGVSPSQGPDDCELDALKIDDTNGDGPWASADGVITVSQEGDAKHYSFTTDGTVVVHAAHLKGGSEYTSYYFDPAVTSANNLWTPNNPGNEADLSNIWFCYGEPSDDPDPSPSPEPSDSPSPEPSESPSPGASEPPSVDDSKSPEPEPGLPVTGSQVGILVGLGVALLGAGGAMMFLRKRRDLRDVLDS